MLQEKARLEVPPKLKPIFLGDARYRGAYGGRGSGKTRSFALMAAVKGYQHAMAGRSGIILCAREYQNSLEDSSMQEVKQAIAAHDWLASNYDVGERYIRIGGIKFAFDGLRHNIASVKGKSEILLAWIDEAEQVAERAWEILPQTIRSPGSEIWVTWNPEKDGSPTDERFRKSPPRRCKIVELNYIDNPWFPPELEEERQNDRDRLDDGTYAHIWEGAYLENSDSQILAGKYRVAEFKPGDGWDGPYQGVDWGFSQDPTAAVRCWVHDDRLWIEHEAGKVGLEIDATAAFICRRIPEFAKYVARADCARPESISYTQRNGLPRIEACRKWSGSVEDGIAFMRGFREIIIHPRCTGTIREARLYSYKIDRLSGDVLPDIIDANNHYIDAIRYAIGPLIRKREQPPAIIGSYRRTAA